MKKNVDRLQVPVSLKYTACYGQSSSRFQRVLTMVYDTQDYWAFGLCLSSSVLKSVPFRKLDPFPSSGGGGGNAYSTVSVRKG
jgi:hypothetical protein